MDRNSDGRWRIFATNASLIRSGCVTSAFTPCYRPDAIWIIKNSMVPGSFCCCLISSPKSSNQFLISAVTPEAWNNPFSILKPCYSQAEIWIIQDPWWQLCLCVTVWETLGFSSPHGSFPLHSCSVALPAVLPRSHSLRSIVLKSYCNNNRREVYAQKVLILCHWGKNIIDLVAHAGLQCGRVEISVHAWLL